MPVEEQAARPDRYLLIPRTVIFARRGDAYLLLKGSERKNIWPGLYNGVGGHVERGEDVLSSARREFSEETGLEADLWLCGTVIADAGAVGIGLYVFTGEVIAGVPTSTAEGVPEWIDFGRLKEIPTVSDVPPILKQIRSMKRGDPPFAGSSSYDLAGKLHIAFQT